jgi:TM2 domain-containing membrane protein YozV
MSTEPVPSAPIPSGEKTPGSEKKLVAGLLGIFLNCLGIHKFYLGYQKEGLIILLVSVLTCGIGAVVMWPIGLIEGIIYLTKSDQEFVDTYITGRKGWF